MSTLFLVHMLWGIGHVLPKYPLQRRLSGGTIDSTVYWHKCTQVSMLKLLHCAQNDPGPHSNGAEGAFIWESWCSKQYKGFVYRAGTLPLHSCKDSISQDHFIPCLSLYQVHFLVYTSTWNRQHSLPFLVSLCHQLCQFYSLGHQDPWGLHS